MQIPKTYFMHHSFGSFQKEVQAYLQSVYQNSFRYYDTHFIGKNATGTQNADLSCILDGIRYLEDYLAYFYCFSSSFFPAIFENLKNKLSVVSVLEKDRRNIYGQFVPSSKVISLHPSLSNSSTLTGKERTRLYMCHELGHVIHSDWMDRAEEKLANLPEDSFAKQLMYDGFSLLDEALTQNRAEDIAYYYSSKCRPRMRYYSSSLFQGAAYLTNFDYYGELQEPAILFGKTLRGIGNSHSDEEVLKKLSERALNCQFVDQIFYEYQRDGHRDELLLLLMYLGVIKNASYAQFGYSSRNYITQSGYAKDELKKIATPLRDYRPSYFV